MVREQQCSQGRRGAQPVPRLPHSTAMFAYLLNPCHSTATALPALVTLHHTFLKNISFSGLRFNQQVQLKHMQPLCLEPMGTSDITAKNFVVFLSG